MSENRNNLVCISGVRGYEEDGVAYLHIEDSARGLGFTQIKGGAEYVRWETVEKHLSDLSFPTSWENGKPHDYYIPEKNPIATVPSDELIFGQKHNGIDCALCPTAKRACNRAWFSAKQVETWSEMSKMTLWRWLEKLEKARRIATVSDMIQWRMPHEQGLPEISGRRINIEDSCGVPHPTTVLNHHMTIPA